MDTNKTHEGIAKELVNKERQHTDPTKSPSQCPGCIELQDDVAQALHTSQSSLATAIMAVLPEYQGGCMEFPNNPSFHPYECSCDGGWDSARTKVLTILKSRGLVL